MRGFEDLGVSPDGNRVATTIVENVRADVWIYNRERDALTQLTEKGACGDPLWSPDGNRVVYTDPENLYIVPADSGSPPVSLVWGRQASSPNRPLEERGVKKIEAIHAPLPISIRQQVGNLRSWYGSPLKILSAE